MRNILIILLFIASSAGAQLRRPQGEMVNWNSPAIYVANSFEFKSDKMKYTCKDCEILEIKTISGVTGYYVTGKGKITIKKKGISEEVTSCLLRFNPLDTATFIKINGLEKKPDEGYLKSSQIILTKSFRHCHHAGMDALIPPKGAYALNFFGTKSGEVLASYSEDEYIVYVFTDRKQL
jgi:hypothetical protein